MEILKASDFIGNVKGQEIASETLGTKINQIAYVFYQIFQGVVDTYGIFDNLNRLDFTDEKSLNNILHKEFIRLYETINKILEPVYQLDLFSWVNWGLTFAGELPDDGISENVEDIDQYIYLTSFRSTLQYLINLGLLPPNLSNLKIVSNGTNQNGIPVYASLAATLETPDIESIKDIFNEHTRIDESPIYILIRLTSAYTLFNLANRPNSEQQKAAELSEDPNYYINFNVVSAINIIMFLYVLGFLDPVILKNINKIYNTIKPKNIMGCMAINDELFEIAKN